jgi:pyoverdine/dityrosine biosynthesis protein Dit1
MQEVEAMNDFTKKELQLLTACVFSKFIASLEDPAIQHYQTDLKNMYNKIEAMIDNYCGHNENYENSEFFL